MTRLDFERIARWIGRGATVLDLGCGDGDMLLHLKQTRGAKGVGVDIDGEHLANCLRRGVQAVQADINLGLSLFGEGAFDFVVLSQTLQNIAAPPQHLIGEMLRIGRSAIVSFPNFVHWRLRRQLLSGKMPVGPQLPHPWHSTPNVRYCSIRDFENLCNEQGFAVKDRFFLHRDTEVRRFPNLLAESAAYHLVKPSCATLPPHAASPGI